MKIVESVKEMQVLTGRFRQAGRTIAFVPTMGYLHRGHLELLREGRKRGDVLVLSIYVNPTQFGAGEDLEKYPRNLERDYKMAEGEGVDVVFCPASGEMYPEHYQTFVNVEEVTGNLCGLSREGHFRGVATVCCKLFNIINPQVAIFGQKDFQQLVVIRRMVQDLNMGLSIIGLPTVREPDGLAMSSRNVYLSEKERETALCLSRALLRAKGLFEGGAREAPKILKAVTELLTESPLVCLEYAKICDLTTLKDIPLLDRPAVLALAAKVGQTRLIDNYVFGEALEIASGK